MNRKQRRQTAKHVIKKGGHAVARMVAADQFKPMPLTGGGVAGALLRHASGARQEPTAIADPEAALRLGIGELQAGRLGSAARHLQSVLAIKPADIRAMQLLGVVSFEQGDAALALDLLRGAVAAAPDYADAQHNLGLVLSSLEDFDAAVLPLRKAVELSPRNADFWLNLGNAERGLGQLGAAAVAYDKAVALAPDNPLAGLNRANLTMEQNELVAALAQLDDLVSQYPDFAAAHNSRGGCLIALNRAEEGAMAHAKAAEMAPDNEEYKNNMREAWGNLIPAWHLPMLADEARNSAYQQTIDKHVRQGMHILDIGSGSGLLAMMAAQAGATRVTAVEMNPVLAVVARQIVADNALAERITVLNRVSMDLEIDDNLPAADLVVSEILDAGLLGEGVLPTLRHAARYLLKPGGRMVPAGATVYGQLMELPNLRTVNPVGRIAGFDLSAFDRFRNPAAHRQIALAGEAHRALSDPFLIAEFDFAAPPAGANWREVTIPITASGEAYAVVFWFDLHLDETISVSSAPGGSLSHWDQAVQFLAQGRMATVGELLSMTIGHTDTRFHFSF